MNRSRFIVLLTAVLALAAVIFTSCAPAKEAFDADKVLERLLTEVAYGDELEDSAAYSDFLLGELPEGTEVKLYTASGMHADTVMRFLAADESDKPAIRSVIDGYISSLSADVMKYDANELPKLQNAVVYENGLYIFVCITDDTAAAKAILH